MARKKKQRKAVLLRLRDRDTPSGVSGITLRLLATTMGMTETEVIHKALAECAKSNLPRYEPDDGALSEQEHQEIDKLTADARATYRETESLFGEPTASRVKSDGTRIRSTPRSR